MAEAVQTRTEGAVLEVTLDRPKANTIDLKTSREMGETFRAYRDDSALRVCIVRTAGHKFFSAGWDSKRQRTVSPSSATTALEVSRACKNSAANKPVIAAYTEWP